jgi:alkanesulfonate monooxygenase SsuD/methylene tetrahydromethanopterin reductase-like flavin-dependent oxidoreductase (luciferase family)
MWSGKPVTFKGKHYQISEAVCKPIPVHSEGLCLWIGGGGEKLTLRVTAKHADACNFSGRSNSLEAFNRKLEILEKHCQAIGRRFEDIVKSVTLELILGENKKEAHRKERCAPKSISPETRFVGTPSECINFLQKFVNSGATYIMIHAEDILSSFKLFKKEVMPSFH